MTLWPFAGLVELSESCEAAVAVAAVKVRQDEQDEDGGVVPLLWAIGDLLCHSTQQQRQKLCPQILRLC